MYEGTKSGTSERDTESQVRKPVLSDHPSLPQNSGRRWVQLWLGVVCMALIANLQYGWTLFVEPMHAAHGWQLAEIQWAFSIFIAAETWLTPAAGSVVDRLPPRAGPAVMTAAGGLLIGAGWVVNAGADSLSVLYVGSALSGLGAGAIYATCVGNAVKWFPDRRGIAVGLTAAGFGAGAALTVVPIRLTIAVAGYQQAFFWFGLGQAAVLVVIARVLRAPDRAVVIAAETSVSLQQASAQLGLIASDYGVSNRPILLGATTLTVALVVDNVLNGLARPFFGGLSDRIGRERTMALAFSLGAMSDWLLAVTGHAPWGFVICAGLIFFTWGEIFSLFGVRPCGWTESSGSFDHLLGMLILKLHRAEVAQGRVQPF
jgi:MFS transporter, OFA family, oxalate/formate antiporter